MATTSPLQPNSSNATATTPATANNTTNASGSTSSTQQSSTVYPSLDQLKASFPDQDVQNLQKCVPLLLREMAANGLTSRGDLIGMLATVGVEANFSPIEELPGSPGREPVYFGRGFIQLTGVGNYRDFGEFMKMDFVNNPERILEPELAAKSSVWYWKDRKVSQYAQAFDWKNVRSMVNAGHPDDWISCWGTEKYLSYIDACEKNLPSGIDPNSLGALPANYGLGCVDTNGAGSRTLSASLNPSSFADALAYALGIHSLERSKSHEFRAILDCAADPTIMKLDAQKTFLVQGIGDGLDGDYTCEEVNFVLTENGLQAEVIGFKPDPNAPPVQIFDHNANGSTPSAQLATPAIPGQNIVSNEEIKLAVPYYAQKDNSINPDYSCQATSLAMALEFLGVKGAGTQRFADEIYAKLSSRGVPGTCGLMADLVREYGKKDDLQGSCSDEDVKNHLKKQMPVIIHGDFTSYGHVVCCVGFNSTGFWVHDPWYKFTGPRPDDYDYASSGQYSHHPYTTTVAQIWHQGGTNCAHFLSN